MKAAPKASEVSLACVRCDLPLRTVRGAPDSPANQAAWNDAMVHDMHAGYGSRFDCGAYIVGLCDNCISALEARGQIVEFGR